MKRRCTWKRDVIAIGSLAMLLALPGSGIGAGLTTRQQTIHPIAIPDGTPPIAPSNVSLYAAYGYSAWQAEPGEDQGRRFDLMPAGYAGAGHAARLVSFFSMSDIHLTDKESPAQGLYYGWTAPFGVGGLSAAYSPVILSTTHLLDAAIRTVNALHGQAPFDCGIFLGDAINNTQLNELRWYMDVIDGRMITPSSGEHRGADTIDYQMPYQAAGLDPSIPWYQVVGNHDQFWSGVAYVTPKLMAGQIGSNVLNIGTNIQSPTCVDEVGAYMGVVDGTTPYGEVVGAGLTNAFAGPLTVAADTNRHTLATADSPCRNWMGEFFHTASLPVGHGFRSNNVAEGFACYTFEPKTNVPLKVIVLDDTAKSNLPAVGGAYYASGSMDQARYAWLTNELQRGQDAGQLMILAAHVPILPQRDLFITNSAPQFPAPPLSDYSDAQLVAALHGYPNLILVMAGHRHVNVVTPFPSPDPAHPEYGFWEVETPSLRDFPQQFRTWDIRRNTDHTISILVTCVDPLVETNSPAWKSRGYAVGTARVFANVAPTDTTSRAYNAELVVPLTPAMQARLATVGTPLQPGGNDYNGDGRSDLAVYDTNVGNWYAYNLQSGQATLWAQAWGWPGAETVPGDYDGDAVSDLCVYDQDSGAWYAWSQARQEVLMWAKPWGWTGAQTVGGDYNGDRTSDLAVYDQASGLWYITTPADTVLAWQRAWGWPGAVTVPGDYDGDGIGDLCVYDSLRGFWYAQSLAGTTLAWEQAWGWPGAATVPGDYDGDGASDLAVYDQPTGNWYVWSLARSRVLVWQQAWGWTGAVPVPGDYDGDAIADLAVFDTARGFWYIWSVGTDAVIAWQQPWGWPGARPPGGRN